MTATFDPTLASEKDWVRLLIGDTNTTSPALDDATIDAVLRNEPNRWYAAALCVEIAFARFQQAGGGILSKTVGALSITRASGQDWSAAYSAKATELRSRGAREISPAPYSFRVL